MKRSWLCLALTLALLFPLCFFGSRTKAYAESAESTPTPAVTDNRKKTKGTAISDADFETDGYLYEDDYGNSFYFALVKNNGSSAVEVTCNASALDAAGNKLAIDDATIDVLGPGETSYAVVYFQDTTGIADVEADYTYKAADYCDPVVGNISISQVLNDGNVVVTATNNGTEDAQFLEGLVLFFDENGQVISYSTNYLMDGDMTLKPGVSLSEAFVTYDENYDHVEVYLSGCSDGTGGTEAVPVMGEDFDVEEYPYESMFSTCDYISIKNNSSETYGIYGNAVAKDADGVIVDAADLSIDVLGPGETQLGSFSFDTDADIASVEYQLFVNTGDSYYEPAVASLSGEATVNDKNVILSVTNNGSQAAEFVEAECLYFDQDGKVVCTDSVYVTDNDYEIKPNATVDVQLSADEPYAYALVFLSGYADKNAKANAGDSTTGNVSVNVSDGVSVDVNDAAGNEVQVDVDYRSVNTVIQIGDIPLVTVAVDGNNAEVNVQFKQLMDSYEQFFEEYAEFMRSYAKNPTDLSLLTRYTSMLAQYADIMGKLNNLDQSAMTADEYAYYSNVMVRINQLLVGVAG